MLSRRMLHCLEALPDLNLQLVAVDARSKEGLQDLVSGLEKPLGGCMLLSVVLSDGLFSTQTQESYEAAFVPKTGAFETVESVVALDELDFVFSFSSVSAMFGNAGQTNYAG